MRRFSDPIPPFRLRHNSQQRWLSEKGVETPDREGAQTFPRLSLARRFRKSQLQSFRDCWRIVDNAGVDVTEGNAA